MHDSHSTTDRPAASAAVAPRRSRGVVFALVSLFVFIVLGTFAVEAALWIFAPMKFHEWITPIPDGHILGRMEPFQVVDNARGNQVRINKHGFRGPDYAWDRPPGTLRLETFGGSCTFEYFSSSDEKTWPGALEKKLRERLHMPVEVINLGLPGFNNFVGKINYQCHGRAFQPNIIIVYEAFNDMGNRWFRAIENEPYHPMGNISARPLWMQLARMSQIGRRGRTAWFTLMGRSLEGAYVLTDEKKEPVLSKPVDPKAFAWFRRNFEDFALLAKADHVLPVLCTQAFIGSRESIQDPKIRQALLFAPDRCGMTLELLVDTYEKMGVIVKDVAEKNACIFFDGYAAVPHDLDHIRDNVHFFDKGSEVLAEAMAAAFLADPRFMSVVETVRSERAGPSGSH